MVRWIILLVLLSCLVWAQQSNELYDSVFRNGDQVDISNTLFDVTLTTNGGSMKLLSDNAVFIIDTGDCQVIGNTRLCFNYALDIDGWEAYITAYNYEPELLVTKTISPQNGTILDSYRVAFTVTNTGDTDLDDVLIEDFLPAFATHERGFGCNFDENRVYNLVDLDIGDSESCEYRVSFSQELQFSGQASASYFFEEVDYVVYSNETQVNISALVNTDYAVDDERVFWVNDTNITITVTGTGNQIDYEQYITIPEGVKIEASGLSVVNQTEFLTTYLWSMRLKNLTPREKSIEFSADTSGVFPIVFSNRYEYGDVFFDTPFVQVLDFYDNFSGPALYLWINATPEEPERGQKVWVEYILRNINTSANYTNVDANVYFNGERVNGTTQEIIEPWFGLSDGPNAYILNVTEDWNVTVNVTGFLDGVYTVVENSTLNILKGSDDVELVTGFSQENFSVGDVITREVNITNKKESDVDNILVYEILPAGLRVLTGGTERLTSVRPSANVTAYSYSFVPDVSGNFTFISVISYDHITGQINAAYNETIEVKPANLSLVINQSVVNDTGFIGEVFEVTYLLENEGEVPLENVNVVFPTNTFVARSTNSFSRDFIPVGEQVKIVRQVQVFEAGNITVPPLLFDYQEGEQEFSGVSEGLNLSINGSAFVGPVPKVDIVVGDVYNVTISNSGNQDLRGTFVEPFVLQAGEQINVEYDANISSSILVYEWEGTAYSLQPNVTRVNVSQPAVSESQEEIVENITLEVQVQPPVEPVETPSTFSFGFLIPLVVALAVIIVGIGAAMFFLRKPKLSDAYLTPSDRQTLSEQLGNQVDENSNADTSQENQDNNNS